MMATALACLGDKQVTEKLFQRRRPGLKEVMQQPGPATRHHAANATAILKSLPLHRTGQKKAKRMRPQVTQCWAVARITMFTVQPRSLPAQDSDARNCIRFQ